MSVPRNNIDVVVIIPTYNRWSVARKAIESVLSSEHCRPFIVLIADGCTDETCPSCRSEFPEVEVIEGDGNLWWSGCINRGIEYAEIQNANAVIWLNDDNVVTPSTVANLIASHQREGDRSIICGRVKTLGGSGHGDDEWRGEPPVWHPDYSTFQSVKLSDVDVQIEHPPGGRGVLIPMACIREIGSVAEKELPQYWADHDFHYRAMKAGYVYHISAQAVVYNKPNLPHMPDSQQFSIRWCGHTLFSRRSPLNVVALRRLLKRNLDARTYRRTYYSFVGKTLTWMASGWLARHSMLHRSVRRLYRALPFTTRNGSVC